MGLGGIGLFGNRRVFVSFKLSQLDRIGAGLGWDCGGIGKGWDWERTAPAEVKPHHTTEE